MTSGERPRFATSARDGGHLLLDGEQFPFYITEEGPSVETLAPPNGSFPGFYGVTFTIMVEGEIAGIARETRPASVEELLELAGKKLAEAQRQHDTYERAYVEQKAFGRLAPVRRDHAPEAS